MKILVIGGSGFVGSHVVDKFLREGCDVTIFDRQADRYRPTPKGAILETGEFGNRIQLGSIVARGFDVIVHSLSTTTPSTSNEDIEFDISTNLIGTVKLLEACSNHKSTKLIYVSSGGTIYGNQDKKGCVESDQPFPICSYAINKLAVEKYLYMFQSLYGLDYVSLRVSNPYGERQNPFSGQGAVAAFLQRILSSSAVEIWGDGNTVRDYIHVSDVANACYQAAVRSVRGVYNVGTGVGISLNELVAILGKVTNKTPVIRRLPERRLDVRKVVLDCSRAERDLGWKAEVLLEDGLQRTAKWLVADTSHALQG